MELKIPDICDKHEKLVIFTGFGIRFWDPAMNRQIRDHLSVKIWQDKTNFPVRYAVQTASGNYVFHRIPGMHDIEYPKDGDVKAIQKKYTVEVRDEFDRFMPVVFQVDLPLPKRGLYLSNNGKDQPGFNLFSSPSRTSHPNLVSVRGLLYSRSKDCPASYAFMEILIDGIRWYGISNKRGLVTVIFPYPKFKNALSDLPENMKAADPFSQQKWPVKIRIRSSPDLLKFTEGTDLPLLKSISGQKEVSIWETKDSSVIELGSEITFGQEFILKTKDSSVLLVD